MGVSWEKALAALLRTLFEDVCRATALADRECGPQADLNNQECIFLWSEVWAGHQQPPCDAGVSQVQAPQPGQKRTMGLSTQVLRGLGKREATGVGTWRPHCLRCQEQVASDDAV